MPAMTDPKKQDFETPATYGIEVSGELTESLRRRIADGSIEIGEHDEDPPRSTLMLRVEDQAELRGLLDALYGFQLTVISVKRRDAHETKENGRQENV